MAMQDLSGYLTSLNERLGDQKAEELAQLNIAEQRFTRWCSGDEIPDDESCIKIALMAGDDPAKVLILKNLSSAPVNAKAFWEKVSIKYRDGRTISRSMDTGVASDRRRRVQPFDGADRRASHDRRRGLDRRLALAI